MLRVGLGVTALDSACGSVCLGLMWEVSASVRAYPCLWVCAHRGLWARLFMARGLSRCLFGQQLPRLLSLGLGCPSLFGLSTSG